MKKVIFTIFAASVIDFFAPAANAQMIGARLPVRQGGRLLSVLINQTIL